jgi:F-type H+-transporting ATPase subunit epsilon
MATDHTLDVSIVTPQSTAWSGKVLAIAVPGSKGPFQVLYNHAPIISSLDPGVMKLEEPDNTITYYACREGFVEVLANRVSIIVNELIPSTSIDEARAEASVEQARAAYDAADRHSRDRALKDLRWAEACMRAARLQREHA